MNDAITLSEIIGRLEALHSIALVAIELEPDKVPKNIKTLIESIGNDAKYLRGIRDRLHGD